MQFAKKTGAETQCSEKAHRRRMSTDGAYERLPWLYNTRVLVY